MGCGECVIKPQGRLFSFGTNTLCECLAGDSFRERLMSYFQRACQGELFSFFKRIELGGGNESVEFTVSFPHQD